MIDLAPKIRAAIISAPLASNISNFNGSKAVFTRRPAPEGAEYPMVFIGPQIQVAQDDFLNGKLRRSVVYDIFVYGQNDEASKYRTVETIAFAISKLFARPTNPFFLSATTGYNIVGIVGTTSRPAPTDDLNIVGRMCSVTITIEET